MKVPTPNYYATIPAEIRYDNELTPNAKLLYGELTALSNAEGYCWASNDYFANLYQVSKRSISHWLKSLNDKKYIRTKLVSKNNSKEIKERRIYISSPHEKNFYTPRRKLPRPHEENFRDNNTSINIINNNNNPPIPPTGEREKIPLIEKRFNEFWEAYPKKKAKAYAKKVWNKLKPNEELHNEILTAIEKQRLSEEWTKQNGSFIPHPSTWLNQGRWEDEEITMPTFEEARKKYDHPSEFSLD